jgi:hypothetical protein
MNCCKKVLFSDLAIVLKKVLDRIEVR